MSAEQGVVTPDVEVSPDAQLPETATPETAPEPTAEAPPQPDKESAKVLSSVQKRIDELTRARYEAERNAQTQVEQWQRHAYELDQRLREVTFQNAQPTLENSNNDFEQYVSRLAQWEAQRMTQSMMAQQGQQAQAAAQHQQQVNIQQQNMLAEQQFVASKIQEGAKVYPDFAKVVGNPELPQLRNVNFPAYQAILESEKGIEVAYYLAKNPLIAHKVALMQPLSAVREIGRIEALFASGKRVSSAPEPISTVGSNQASGGNPEKMSMDEWVKRREKELRAR